MTKNEVEGTLLAYRRGLTADILQARTDGKWGPIWTVPPGERDVMMQAGRQFTRSRAQAVRHTRRARLRCLPSSASPGDVNVVVVTEIPSREQCVFSFEGAVLRVETYLEDEALVAFTASFLPRP